MAKEKKKESIKCFSLPSFFSRRSSIRSFGLDVQFTLSRYFDLWCFFRTLGVETTISRYRDSRRNKFTLINICQISTSTQSGNHAKELGKTSSTSFHHIFHRDCVLRKCHRYDFSHFECVDNAKESLIEVFFVINYHTEYGKIHLV